MLVDSVCVCVDVLFVREVSLLLGAVAVNAKAITSAGATLVQLATIITFVISSVVVVLRYPTPIALSAGLRRD